MDNESLLYELEVKFITIGDMLSYLDAINIILHHKRLCNSGN